MPADLSHFALNADDVEASRTFYEAVLGWTFEAWGPPGFYRIATGGEGAVGGALQERRRLGDGPTLGAELTFSVPDLAATREAVVAAGGRILMERFTIAGVGHLLFFEDPGGNPVGVMQYDPDAGEPA